MTNDALIALADAATLLATVHHFVVPLTWAICGVVVVLALIRSVTRSNARRVPAPNRAPNIPAAIIAAMVVFALILPLFLSGPARVEILQSSPTATPHSHVTTMVGQIGDDMHTLETTAHANVESRTSVAPPVDRAGFKKRRMLLTGLSVGVFLYLVYLILDSATRGSFLRPALFVAVACLVGLCVEIGRIPRFQ